MRKSLLIFLLQNFSFRKYLKLKEVKKMKTPNLHEAKSARVMQVIETVTLAGEGTDASPVYEVRQYWTLDGKLLARDATFSQYAASSASLDQSR